MDISPTNVSGKGRESIFETALEGPRRQVRKPWCWLAIFQGASASVADSSISRGVCWKSWEGPWRLAKKVFEA